MAGNEQTGKGADPVAEPDAGQGTAQEHGGEGSACAAHALAVTQRILALMGLSLTASVRRAEGSLVEIDLEGPDTRLIIGKHGQTLEALQHIVGLVVNKGLKRRLRVVVDAEGYQQRRRQRREQELVEMARADAQRAKETGQEAVIQYAIGSYERRIIHMAFKDDPDFTTYSEGEEPHRYVVISPRD